MNLKSLLAYATDKTRFHNINCYIDFCIRYLEFIETGLQARIISQNEKKYQFFQYQENGNFNISRPLNSELLYDVASFEAEARNFKYTLFQLKDGHQPPDDSRQNLIRSIYTIQQTIGATLDALPSGESNKARKVNGDLFERLIRLLINSMDVDCVSGTMQVPVKDADGNEILKSSYQHDLLISECDELKIIGSVKTSSKDRIDKVFLDKFLYSRLTDTALPHIAIFLNDVQRKKTKVENVFAINSTFLPGHFKAYTIKLNPLDGVYYCDIRPNMISDPLLSAHIKTIDEFFYSDLWDLLNTHGQSVRDSGMHIKVRDDNE